MNDTAHGRRGRPGPEDDLDRLIDALNRGGAPPPAPADPDLADLYTTARRARALAAPEWPAPDYPDELAGRLAGELRPRPRLSPPRPRAWPTFLARPSRRQPAGRARPPWGVLTRGANGLATVALAAVLLGAAALVLSTALGRRGVTGPGFGAATPARPDYAGVDELLLAQFRDAQAAVNFPLALPTALADYESGVSLSGAPAAPGVEAAFNSRQGSQRTVHFSQTGTGLGVVAPLTGATERTVAVRGRDAKLAEGGERGLSHLIWEGDGRSYILTGRDVPGDELVRIAESVVPLAEVLRWRVPRFLSADEAVDLARFRGFHTGVGEISGVPRARETLALALPANSIAPVVADAERRGGKATATATGGFAGSDAPALLVIVRGPVQDGDRTLGNGLAMAFSRTGELLYTAIGGPWDTYTPQTGSVLTLPPRDGPKLSGVSRARAEREIGDRKLIEPVRLPGSLALQRLDINPSRAPIEPSAGPVSFSITSITLVYGDATGQSRLWFTQMWWQGEFLSPPSAAPRPEDGRRYTWERDGRQFLAIARQSGDRWFYASAALGPDLPEAAVAAVIPGDPAAQAPPTPTPRVVPTPFPVTVVAAAEPSYPWLTPFKPVGDSTVQGRAQLLPTGAGTVTLDATFYSLPPEQAIVWILLRGSCEGAVSTAPAGGDRAILRRETAAGRRVQAELPEGWLTGPLAFLIVGGDGKIPLACADLPVDVLHPLPDTPPMTATVRPAEGWEVRGQVAVWPTQGGDAFLRAAIVGPPDQLERNGNHINLIWHVVSGDCAAWRDASGRQQNAGQVLYRDTPPVKSSGQQTFVLGLRQDWLKQPLALAAFVNGGGPFVACADLPRPSPPSSSSSAIIATR